VVPEFIVDMDLFDVIGAAPLDDVMALARSDKHATASLPEQLNILFNKHSLVILI
jgi:hypothetical protein